MESAEKPLITIIAFIDAWYLITIEGEVLQGPYDTHADAVQACEIRAHRTAKGWAP